MSLQQQQHGAIIDGVAANAAEASRTAVCLVKSASEIGFGISLTWGAATALTVQLFKSADDGNTYQRVPSLDILSGTGTASDYTVSKAVTATDTLWVDTGVGNATHVKIIVAATSGGAGDLITVVACSSSWS